MGHTVTIKVTLNVPKICVQMIKFLSILFHFHLDNRGNYLELNDQQERKLKLLSLVTFATKDTVLAYSKLQDVLHMETVRDLEDLIIEAIYNVSMTTRQNLLING